MPIWHNTGRYSGAMLCDAVVNWCDATIWIAQRRAVADFSGLLDTESTIMAFTNNSLTYFYMQSLELTAMLPN